MVVADIICRMGGFLIAGFLDDVDPRRRGEGYFGSTILGGRECLADLRKSGIDEMAIAVGDCDARLRLTELAREEDLCLPAIVHPSATIAASASVGEGTVVAAGAIVSPGARIGASVLLNTACSVDHECYVADGAHICPGARLAGRVRIGRGAWIGIGSALIAGITVGDRAIVGAGAVVVRDIAPSVVAFGVPARAVRVREALT